MTSVQELRVIEWNDDEGDSALRFDYPLNKDSVVVDLGAYRGDFAQKIWDLYGARLYLSEPMPNYVAQLRERFRANERITILPFAMGPEDGTVVFALAEDGTSAFKGGDDLVSAPVRSICEVLDELGISKIDLLKINIEGAEYDVLDELIASGWASKISNIQVQFHEFAPNASERLDEVRSKLGLTHYPTYLYKFVWENWRIKSGNDLESVVAKLMMGVSSYREKYLQKTLEAEFLRDRLNRMNFSWWIRRLRNRMKI